MPRTLGRVTTAEICVAMTGLKGAQAREMATQLSQQYDVTVNRIYAMTKHVRPPRKPRGDRGKRTADLMEHPGLRFAAEQVALKHLDPDLALETARANGFETPVKVETFRRYLLENDLGKAARKAQRAYRRFEAKEAGMIYQFDISACKERWLDLRTRKILKVASADVNDNHPNRRADRVPVWKFVLVDDHSRRLFIRYYAVPRPTSVQVVDCLLHGFREMGVPLELYTDNDGTITGKRMQRAAAVLDKAFADTGGFKCSQHAPHNPQATGKVERAHQIAEKFEKLIGIKLATPTLDEINTFAVRFCERHNWLPHRATGEAPMLRWRAGLGEKRMPPPAMLDAAFKCDEFTAKVRGDVTISVAGQTLQLPRGEQYPFTRWAEQNRGVTVLWFGEQAEFFVVIGDEGTEYEIGRKPAQADVAGEFKAVADTRRQRNIKLLKESHGERMKALKEAGAELIVPGFDVDFERERPQPVLMPKREAVIAPARWSEVLPGAAALSDAAAMASSRELDFTGAVLLGREEDWVTLDTLQEDRAWLRRVFNGREAITEQELRAALATRGATNDDEHVADTQTTQPLPHNVVPLLRRAG